MMKFLKYSPREIKDGVWGRFRKYLDLQSMASLKKNIGLWETLSRYIKKSHSTGCSYSDYWVLYLYVRNKKPREILECGTGVSTIVMAYALMENKMEGYNGRITSMEEVSEYYENAKRLLPDTLKKHTEIILSSTVEDCHHLFRGMRFNDTPNRKYDFVFIDGPNPQTRRDKQKTFDFDFLRIVEQADVPVSAIIDKRFSTCWVFQKIFSSEKVKFDFHRGLGFVLPVSRNDLRSANEIAHKDSCGIKHTSIKNFLQMYNT